MKILSIDGSTKSTGVAIFQNNKLLYYNNITVNNNNVIKRINYMTKKIKEIIQEYNPTIVVMQQVFPEYNQNVYKALIYLQAAIAIMLNQFNLQLTLYVASHWRNIIGIKTGKTIKRKQLKQISIQKVKEQYNIQVNDDIADAINIGRAYYIQHGSAF